MPTRSHPRTEFEGPAWRLAAKGKRLPKEGGVFEAAAGNLATRTVIQMVLSIPITFSSAASVASTGQIWGFCSHCMRYWAFQRKPGAADARGLRISDAGARENAAPFGLAPVTNLTGHPFQGALRCCF